MPRIRNQFPDFKHGEMRRMFHNLPRIIGRMAVNFYVQSFRRSGFIDQRYERWPARKPAYDNGRKRRGGNRALLIQSGRLRRSIRVVRMTNKSVTVGSDVPYAQIHNEGGTIRHPGGTPYIVIKGKVRFIRKTTATRRANAGQYVKRTKPHMIAMPKRQFMGQSDVLNQRIMLNIKHAIEKIVD